MVTTEEKLSTKEIASRLAHYCETGEWEKAQRELYAVDVKSIEPYETPGYEKEIFGLDAVLEKGHRFMSTVEKIHSISVSDHLITENVIAFVLHMDIEMKGKDRMNMNELCVYHVKNGKIDSEQFFV
jgi:hypothetical protein